MDISAHDANILEQIRPYTMTGRQRQLALLDAVAHIVAENIPGALVECGVWRGGSVLAMLLKLQSLGADPRPLFLYDTFEGMTAPSDRDTSAYSEPARQTWERAEREGATAWSELFDPTDVSLAAVRGRLSSTGYPAEHLHLVAGDIAETVPADPPEQIALLRLDTDWYDSTRVELEHLYPRLVPGGILIVDDYGHWRGCREAVDEYFARDDVVRPLLVRVDYTGRVAVKSR